MLRHWIYTWLANDSKLSSSTPSLFIMFKSREPKAHCDVVMPNLLSSIAKCLSVSASGIPISFFHSATIPVTVPAPNLRSLAILSLWSPFSHLPTTSLFMLLPIGSLNCYYLYYTLRSTINIRHDRQNVASNPLSLWSSVSSGSNRTQRNSLYASGLHFSWQTDRLCSSRSLISFRGF